MSVDGMLGSEAEFLLLLLLLLLLSILSKDTGSTKGKPVRGVRRLGDFLGTKWERPYSVVMEWVRVRLSFAIP